MKRSLLAAALCAALTLTLTLLAGCGGGEAESSPTPSQPAQTESVSPDPSPSGGERTQINFAVLRGPTGVGAAKLLSDNADGLTENQYNVTIASDPATEISPNLINGTLDIAAVSTNLASTLYHRTEGGVQLLALNTLGVLYILENGDSVRSVSDLAGRTIYATGQASNPEYVLNHLLRQNGLEPGEDVDLQWRTSDEVTALMAAGEIDLCMLPVPAATAVQLQNDQVRAALDLTQLWDELDSGSVLTMGCVVVRTEFAQENPEAVAAFLEEYAASIDFVSSDPEAAAPMVARFGITASEEIALAAIPDCSLVCITGADMRDSIQGYYEVLAAADPASIGGAIPDDAFYYIP